MERTVWLAGDTVGANWLLCRLSDKDVIDRLLWMMGSGNPNWD